MKSATINLESLKLHVIQDGSQVEPTLSRKAVKYLIKALEYADSAFTAEIETALFKAGGYAMIDLLRGLQSANLNVKSTCAMVLIRLGQAAVEPLQHFYVQYAHRESVAMAIAFILTQLGEDLPEVQAPLFLEELLVDSAPLELVS